ncbi:MAG: hypothetical protein RRY26_03250 [Cellulosilyticaceae bacterium]
MSNEKYLGNDYYQLTGKHLMGNNIKYDIDPESIMKANEAAAKEQLAYVSNMLEKDKDCKPFENKHVVPTSGRVVVLPYDKNPYRQALHQSTSGLILGDFETSANYKSQETGEQEAAQRGIWCCKVIAVGNECKSVLEGEDVYINFTFASPLPFGGKGYYTISENSIICSIRNNE